MLRNVIYITCHFFLRASSSMEDLFILISALESLKKDLGFFFGGGFFFLFLKEDFFSFF